VPSAKHVSHFVVSMFRCPDYIVKTSFSWSQRSGEQKAAKPHTGAANPRGALMFATNMTSVWTQSNMNRSKELQRLLCRHGRLPPSFARKGVLCRPPTQLRRVLTRAARRIASCAARCASSCKTAAAKRAAQPAAPRKSRRLVPSVASGCEEQHQREDRHRRRVGILIV
jgi:hypothetical protein